MKVYIVRAKEGIGIIYGVFEAREDAERYSGGADVAVEGYEVSPAAYLTQQIDKTDLDILTTVMGRTPDRTKAVVTERSQSSDVTERSQKAYSAGPTCGGCGTTGVSMTFAYRHERWYWQCDRCYANARSEGPTDGA